MAGDGYSTCDSRTCSSSFLQDGQTPGAGTGAGLAIALAASVVAMAARRSTESWQDAGGIAAQAVAIRTRALELAHADAEAWQRVLAALARVGEGIDPRRDFALEQDLDRAAAVPLELAELGADAATLAAVAAARCEGPFRADAAAAVGPLESAVVISIGEDDEVAATEDVEGDVSGHGMACAGIVRRLVPDCSISSVRVLGSTFTGSGAVLLGGLRYAIE